MAEGYAKSGNQWATVYQGWRNVAAQPYVSDTHGARYVNNYANDFGADNYSLFEEAGAVACRNRAGQGQLHRQAQRARSAPGRSS